jgi:hypothetical protein
MTFQMPDGSMRTVDVPGSASEEDARQFALESFGEKRKGQNEGIRGGIRGLRDPIDASAQLLERVLPEGVVQRINQLNNWLADQGLPLVRLDERGLQGQLDDAEVAYQAGRSNPDSMDWPRLGGQVGGGIAAGAATAPARAATVGGRLMQGALGGAVGGAISEPLTQTDDFWKEKGEQTGAGAVAGGALGGIGEGVGALGRQVTRPEVQMMGDIGVSPTPGQTLGGVADSIEQKMTSIPVVGERIAGARTSTLEEMNTGVINEALTPLGRTVEGNGREALAEANRYIDDAYAEARSLVDNIDLDDDTMSRLAAFDADLDVDVAADNARRIRTYIERRLMARATDGRIDPGKFKLIDSELGKKAAATNDPELSQAYIELQQILRDTAARQSPDYAMAKMRADAAFRNMVAITDAAGRRTDSEPFTPKQLGMSIRKTDRSARRRTSAEGGAPLQDVALAAEDVLGTTVPSSGTVERGSLLGGAAAVTAGAIDPISTLAGASGLWGLYTDPIRRALFELSQRTGVPMGHLSGSGALGGAGGAAAGGLTPAE